MLVGMRTLIRRVRAFALVFPLLAAGVMFGPAADAQPVPVEQLTCSFGATVTFDPGLGPTATAQDIGGEAKFGNKLMAGTQCLSQTGIEYTGATGTINGEGELACTSSTELEGEASGQLRLHWFIGEQPADTSVIEGSVTFIAGVPALIDATVDGGQVDGATVIVQATPTSGSGNCVLDLITSVSFTGSVTFIVAQ